MGYRSNVRSVIYGQKANVEDFISKYKQSLDLVSLEIASLDFKDVGENLVIHLHHDSVKWYEDYPEVIAWKDLLISAEAEGLAYEFIEIGQEMEDFTSESGGDSRGLIGYERKTVSNCPEIDF